MAKFEFDSPEEVVRWVITDREAQDRLRYFIESVCDERERQNTALDVMPTSRDVFEYHICREAGSEGSKYLERDGIEAFAYEQQADMIHPFLHEMDAQARPLKNRLAALYTTRELDEWPNTVRREYVKTAFELGKVLFNIKLLEIGLKAARLRHERDYERKSDAKRS